MAEQNGRGIFITLEGVDGCGKSTKGRYLAEELTAAGREVVSLRDPGSTEISERIRAILLDPEVEGMVHECELMLFEAARAQLTREVIMPALERDANAMGSCGLVPDRTIVFDLEVDESFERATRHGTDRMELDGEPFQQRVREGFLRLAAEEPERVRVVNAHGEKLEVYARMRAELIDLFPELGEEAV